MEIQRSWINFVSKETLCIYWLYWPTKCKNEKKNCLLLLYQGKTYAINFPCHLAMCHPWLKILNLNKLKNCILWQPQSGYSIFKIAIPWQTVYWCRLACLNLSTASFPLYSQLETGQHYQLPCSHLPDLKSLLDQRRNKLQYYKIILERHSYSSLRSALSCHKEEQYRLLLL